MSQSRTILFMVLDCHGCINPSLAIAQVLVNQGHRVVFILEKPFEGKLAPYGIQEEILPSLNTQNEQDNKDNKEEHWPRFVTQNAKALRGTTIDNFEHFVLPGFTAMAEVGKAREEDNKKIIEKVKPDLLVLDTFYCSPAFTNSSIPWVRVIAANPLWPLEDERFPPALSGLPSDAKYQPEWEKFLARKKELYIPLWNSMNEWVTSLGAPAIPPNPLFHPDSPYANLYLTPKEIDLFHQEIDHLRVKPKWHQFDSLVREEKGEFELPQSLSEFPLKGKLVYLSMGTIGSADVILMKKLVDILANSPNRFVVSKGVQGDKYELASNMWGKNSLPQTKILPLVDLYITHGGNNSITESFHFGKPMIVMPLFSDQFDNAQRVAERGFGVRMNPYHCEKDELLNAVDQLLSDDKLAKRMKLIGERIRSARSNERAAELILAQIKKH